MFKYSTLKELRLMESISKLDSLSIINILDNNLEKGLISDELYNNAGCELLNIVEKGKNSPIGTIAVWSNGSFKKISASKWVLITKNDNNLSQEEIKAINVYSGEDYRRINKALNKDNYLEEAKVIDKALDKLEKFEGITYRGISSDNVEDLIQQYKENKGSLVQYEAFTSSTESENIARSFGSNILFEIKSKNGKNISQFTRMPHEKEVLFKTSSVFKVISIKKEAKDRYKVNLEEY